MRPLPALPHLANCGRKKEEMQNKGAALGKLGAFYISLGYHAVIWV